MRISDWSSDVCSSDLWRGEERQIANTVFPGSIHLVINGPLYRCTRAQECPSGREGNCVGLRPERIAHKLHHATGMLQDIALYDPAEGRRSEERRVGNGVSVRVTIGVGRVITKKKHNT